MAYRDLLPPSAARYAPSDFDSEESLHTIDDDDDGEISSYEDCLEEEVDAVNRYQEEQVDARVFTTQRPSYVDIGDEEITFRASGDQAARIEPHPQQAGRRASVESGETIPKRRESHRSDDVHTHPK